MGWFLKTPKAIDILNKKKHTNNTNEKKEEVKEYRCCICGALLDPAYEEGPEYEDGTDDIYDVCWNCSGKFERWIKEKHLKEEEGCL